MKAKIIIILSITCILVVCLFLLWGRLYCPRGVKYGILVKDGVKYILSDEQLQLIISNLQYSFCYSDYPMCGFGDDYMIIFENVNHQSVSTLFIAQDGCGTFRVDNSCYYLEGKDNVKKFIRELLP